MHKLGYMAIGVLLGVLLQARPAEAAKGAGVPTDNYLLLKPGAFFLVTCGHSPMYIGGSNNYDVMGYCLPESAEQDPTGSLRRR
jgi:hypothetical protein